MRRSSGNLCWEDDRVGPTRRWDFAQMCLASCLCLAACAGSVSSIVENSQISRISIGSSMAEVEDILGRPIASTSPTGYPSGCKSYIYNETMDALFVHVWYVGGKVVEISDRNQAVCGLE
ncbi:outer membrane protein assembly factor BamE [uncultured Roseobacter sp.]|uniref:outer membrane protein assembly factor BamE domain-containing protein n=2 Tax=uncultured Roseobacter sp. TaxID=114847 RepID=UPI003452EABF